jgi:pilus biogenesis lipoprotein CpaD
MPSIIHILRRARLAIALPLALLAACHIETARDNPIEVVTSHSFDSANWQQLSPGIEPQVEPITLVHVLNFDAGNSRLNEEELDRLREFLQKSGVHDGARIEVDGPRVPGGYLDPLTKSRIEEIRAQLSDLGLSSQVPARAMTLLARPEGSIAVTVTRAMIIPPDCSAPQPAFADRPESTWSCANAANLGSMIVDPADLVSGRTPGPGDGEAAALSVKIYRENKVEELLQLDTSNKQ